MICPTCDGRPTFPPCPTCYGSGIAYCCEGECCEPVVGMKPPAEQVAVARLDGKEQPVGVSDGRCS
jgi:hypothetical protein